MFLIALRQVSAARCRHVSAVCATQVGKGLTDEFFREEYQLNLLIGSAAVPQVSDSPSQCCECTAAPKLAPHFA